MREIQTEPKQPRDEDGRVHPHHDRTGGDLAPTDAPPIEPERVDGRDRPPAGARRPNSPWLGGG